MNTNIGITSTGRLYSIEVISSNTYKYMMIRQIDEVRWKARKEGAEV